MQDGDPITDYKLLQRQANQTKNYKQSPDHMHPFESLPLPPNFK